MSETIHEKALRVYADVYDDTYFALREAKSPATSQDRKAASDEAAATARGVTRNEISQHRDRRQLTDGELERIVSEAQDVHLTYA